MIAFFDASALIYRIEGAEPLATDVRSALANIAKKHPNIATGLSRLTCLECRIGPMKSNNGAILKVYDDFFARTDLVWVELNETVIELATHIRVHHGLKTPDALQAASCLQLGRDHIFLTGDAAFKRVAGLSVKLVGGGTLLPIDICP